jgi:hypothetical protein
LADTAQHPNCLAGTAYQSAAENASLVQEVVVITLMHADESLKASAGNAVLSTTGPNSCSCCGILSAMCCSVDFHTLEQDDSSGAAAEGAELIKACQVGAALVSLKKKGNENDDCF